MKTVPKEEGGSHNRVFGFLHQSTFKDIISYLNQQLEKGPLTEEG